MTTDMTTWPPGRPVLEASALQLGHCADCGSYVVMLEARDGRAFALAHVDDSAEALKRWLAESLGAAQQADRGAITHNIT
jgi:hypothetical protein